MVPKASMANTFGGILYRKCHFQAQVDSTYNRGLLTPMIVTSSALGAHYILEVQMTFSISDMSHALAIELLQR